MTPRLLKRGRGADRLGGWNLGATIGERWCSGAGGGTYTAHGAGRTEGSTVNLNATLLQLEMQHAYSPSCVVLECAVQYLQVQESN